MDRSLLFVGIGGFVGSAARYLVSLAFAAWFSSPYPYATFAVNVAGCLVMGILFGLSERSGVLSNELRALLMAGFCGGFTTFSAFSVETIALFELKHFLELLLYVSLSVALGIAATYAGILIVRSL
jgi:fluoride exporter